MPRGFKNNANDKHRHPKVYGENKRMAKVDSSRQADFRRMNGVAVGFDALRQCG